MVGARWSEVVSRLDVQDRLRDAGLNRAFFGILEKEMLG